MREFLTTNKNGSYANMGINGELARMYAGYLVASLTPPQDRVVALEWIEEYIYDGPDTCNSNIYRTNRIPGAKPVEYSEAGYIPSMHQASDILDFTRNVVMERMDSDCVKIVYECKNRTDHDIILMLEPWLSFRRPDSIAKWGELNFEKIRESLQDSGAGTSVPDNDAFIASFIPHGKDYANIPCEMNLLVKAENAGLSVISNGDGNNCFTEDPRYTKDEETGERGVELWGVCYVPYKFRVVIPAGSACTVSVLCEIHRTDNALKEHEKNICDSRSGQNREFLDTPLEMLRKAGEDAFCRALHLANIEKIQAAFESSHPETAEIYRELVLSASKFITDKTGTSYKTVMAGYPWFLDWGRDTMIAYTGLLLATGCFDTARDVLRSFAKYVRHGMVPNVFPSGSCDEPQYNTVDASLWFFYAADMYARFSGDAAFVKNELYPVLTQITDLYTRSFDAMQAAPADAFCYGIYMDDDGLVHAGTDASDQLTWMDVRIDGKAVTPRHDCPVEIQALMYNALNVMMEYGTDKRYKALADKLKQNAQIFINPQKKCLYDYVEGIPGHRTFNDQIRPNQIWAVSLPYTMFDRETAEQVLNTVREQLVVNLGLRSLAPSEPGYIGRYEGDLRSRDSAYHNGTSWGFLVGHYMLAYMKVYGKSTDVMDYLHGLLLPYLDHMQNDGCIYGIAEVFDGDNPKTGKGCYNQAWSVGCLLEAIYEMTSF